jgi:hypothetical protein
LLKAYKTVIDKKTGIPMSYIKQIINECINPDIKLLFDKIAPNSEFYAELSINSKNNITAVMKLANNANHSSNYKFGSGYQKFLFNIIMRVVFMRNISNRASSMLIIDEGFGCLDEKNSNLMGSALKLLASDFDFIFIVSHIGGINDKLKHPIQIDKIHGHSRIVYPPNSIQTPSHRMVYEMAKKYTKRKQIDAVTPDNITNKTDENIIGHNAAIDADKASKKVVKKADKNTNKDKVKDKDTIPDPNIYEAVMIDGDTHYKCRLCNKTVKKGSVSGHGEAAIHKRNLAKANK